MSILNIFEKLTLEEIEELSKEFKSCERDFFGNELKDSKHRALIAKVFGLKNWNTLIGLKNNKKNKSEDKYRCPKCGSQKFYCVIDAYDYQEIDAKGTLIGSNCVAHMDDRKYQCEDCEYEAYDLRLTYEIELIGFDTSGDKDHLILWINLSSEQDYSFEKYLKENKYIKGFRKIPYQHQGVDLKLNIFKEKNEIDKLIKLRMEEK